MTYKVSIFMVLLVCSDLYAADECMKLGSLLASGEEYDDASKKTTVPNQHYNALAVSFLCGESLDRSQEDPEDLESVLAWCAEIIPKESQTRYARKARQAVRADKSKKQKISLGAVIKMLRDQNSEQIKPCRDSNECPVVGCDAKTTSALKNVSCCILRHMETKHTSMFPASWQEELCKEIMQNRKSARERQEKSRERRKRKREEKEEGKEEESSEHISNRYRKKKTWPFMARVKKEVDSELLKTEYQENECPFKGCSFKSRSEKSSYACLVNHIKYMHCGAFDPQVRAKIDEQWGLTRKKKAKESIE